MARESVSLRMARAARLKQARETMYDSARAAAQALQIPEQTYYPYENGQAGYAGRAVELAHKFKVHVNWLLTGNGPMRLTDRHPLLDRFDSLPPDRQREVMDFVEFQATRKP